jgi:branched-chain amino acid transport system ATP-binding protein
VGGLLELQGVSKRFGRVIIAEEVSLAVPAGAIVGIVGPNGAGKTSLFGVISGDIRADAGRIVFDGREISRLGAAERCRLGIGRTYQVPRPFEQMTVFENVLVAAQQGSGARGRHSHALALEALEATRLVWRANEHAGALGLLDRKRLEVARALATQPRLLLLDEVAGGLTEHEVAALVEIVRAAQGRGIAIVWIEHVVRALVSTVDRLLCLAGGQFIADGAPLEVLAHPEVREVYLGSETTAIEVLT